MKSSYSLARVLERAVSIAIFYRYVSYILAPLYKGDFRGNLPTPLLRKEGISEP